VIYFTADLHLGHANIIKHCDRPFTSVDEMDDHLIKAWNSRVRPNDTIYIIGDLIFRNSASPDSYLSRLRGKKHLILGNHDKDWVKKTDMSQHFISVERYVEFSDGQHRITLCHYPLMSWNHIAKGSYMIHGHIHNNQDAMYFPLMREMPNLLNAGVEINGYHPVKLDELIKNNDIFKSGHFVEKEVVEEL
jgi:calcineurin-like phosphoesterase family protein